MPITPPKEKSNAQEEKSDDVKVVTEEEYRERMKAEIRREVEQELRASPKGADTGGGKRKKAEKKTDAGRNRHQFSLRFQPEMFAWLTQAAENESRSITNLITTYLELVQHIPTWELRQLLDNESRKRRSKRNR